MTLIIPTIFATNKKQFEEKFRKLLPIANNIQIDFMDGKFVKAKSFSLKEIPNLNKYKNKFEAHLMVKSPEKYLTKLKQKGFKKIIFHIEAISNQNKIIRKIRTLKMKPMIAINPETKVERIPENTDVLLMGVHPGKEHQKLILKTLKKIKDLRKKNKKIKIQIDGGVSPKTIKKLKKAGADVFNSGSFISEAENSKEAFNKLKFQVKE